MQQVIRRLQCGLIVGASDGTTRGELALSLERIEPFATVYDWKQPDWATRSLSKGRGSTR